MVFKVGVIGAGTHGTRYLRHARSDVSGMSVAALCRRSKTAGTDLARELDCRYHPSPEDLIADPQVDGVIICTPPSSHFQLAEQVLRAGKPLLLEKPMTGTLTEARQLAALQAGLPESSLMVAHTLRWNPVIMKARQLWRQLGQVHLLRLAQRLEPTQLAWQRDPAQTVGGSVLLTGVHIFDLARHLTGQEFVAMDSRQANICNPEAEDLFLARGKMNNGTWVSLEVSKYTRSRAAWLEAVGTEGQIFADYLRGGIQLRTGAGEKHVAVAAAVPTLPLVLADWLKAVNRGGPPPVTLDDGLATLQVAEACYRSAREQAEVSVDTD